MSVNDRVELARRGLNPYVIARLPSGWLVIGDVQPVLGYCLLLADPIVESLNALDEAGRIRYSLDVARVGDALLEVTGAERINYETWGNQDPFLHTHITPRYRTEPWFKRRLQPGHAYPRLFAPRCDLKRQGEFIRRMTEALSSEGQMSR
jgi:diadenosine tetraphosphate (Ap4A) HIT family hydrolase